MDALGPKVSPLGGILPRMPFTVDPTGEIIPMTPGEFFDDLLAHRTRVDMTDEKFAFSIRASVANLQDWLAGNNAPSGHTAALLVRRMEMLT